MNATPISVQDALRGKHILLTGASGFVGKVWLAMTLERVEEIGKITILLRKKGLRNAFSRFERMVKQSHVFQRLHEAHGPDFGAWIARRVEIIEGDISLPGLGLEPEVATRLRTSLDVFINCAGLVDFDPDLQDALQSNVHGALEAARFTASCDHARLLHVSTCFVAGKSEGTIEEVIVHDRTPLGMPLDPREEFQKVTEALKAINEALDTPALSDEIDDAVQSQIAEQELDKNNAALVHNLTRKERSRHFHRARREEGRRRAEALGYPNIYTYTKHLAEALLATEPGMPEFTIFRPAIVESAVEFPFPGWTEGFNTSGPLAYLLGTWFRQLPARKEQPFDVIPVDQACNAMTLTCAALAEGRHAPVYHCGSSDRNRLTIGRALELTQLAHRMHLQREGSSSLERTFLSRWDAVVEEGPHLLSIPNLRRAAKGVGNLLKRVPRSAPLGAQARLAADFVTGADKQLGGVERMLDAFRPFIRDFRQVFVCRAIDAHPAVEPEFAFAPERIRWLHYWTEIHMPGLQKWSFPVYEGRAVPNFRPAHPFHIPRDVDTSAIERKREAS
jgi:long-chain acyl-CoA synthetase